MNNQPINYTRPQSSGTRMSKRFKDRHFTYREFLEILKIEFSDFLRLAESGRTVRHASLKARKISIKLRDLLKMYRTISLDNDRKITQIMNTAKEKLEEEFVNE
jgi:hypothetical protein